MKVLTEQQNRGVVDAIIACVGDLKGFPDTFNAVLPQTNVQLFTV